MSPRNSEPPSLKADLALLDVRKAIFHDVPVRRPGREAVEPTLMDEETPLDTDSKFLIEDRIRRTLASSHSFDVQFDESMSTPVRDLVASYFEDPSPENFIRVSHEAAKFLFSVQKGNNSPGLLSLLEIGIGASPALGLIKIESVSGSRLQMETNRGRRHYKMAVLRDLFLTKDTRLFKSALFARNDESLRILACDDQRSGDLSYELAKFFQVNFLGCRRVESPVAVTKRFFTTVIDFINTVVANPTMKDELYDHLTSQMRKHTRRVNVTEFTKDFVPPELRDLFKERMDLEHIPSSFEKNTQEIANAMRKKVVRTERGIIISAPEQASDLVDVKANSITIQDRAKKY